MTLKAQAIGLKDARISWQQAQSPKLSDWGAGRISFPRAFPCFSFIFFF